MVTFNCEICNDTVPKKNTEKHYYRCPNAYYTCIDCSKTFDDGYSYKQHTSCISEDEKYQKSLYRGKKGANKLKTTNNNNNSNNTNSTNNNKNNQNNKNKQQEKQGKKQDSKIKGEVDTKKKVEKEKKVSKPIIFKDGESLYNCLKNIKDKDQKKKLLKSIILKQDPEKKNSFIISV